MADKAEVPKHVTVVTAQHRRIAYIMLRELVARNENLESLSRTSLAIALLDVAQEVSSDARLTALAKQCIKERTFDLWLSLPPPTEGD